MKVGVEERVWDASSYKRDVIFYRDFDQRDQHMPLSIYINFFVNSRECPLPRR